MIFFIAFVLLILILGTICYTYGYLKGLEETVKTLRELRDELRILFEPEDDGEGWKRK